ncbi:MAG: hypothetical protein VX916_07195 [Planctomycetota bacterium]|nr:hypothetical protein [Planctomycetota bacterium]
MTPPPDPNPAAPDPREAFQDLVRAVRRNVLRVAFTAMVCAIFGAAVAMTWPDKYESSTQFVLREWHIVDDSAILGDLQDISLPRKLKTLENELRSRKRIDMVLNELQWVEWLETAGKPSRRRELALKIADNLSVEMDADVTGAHNITLGFTWTSPNKAADFVNRLRDIWIELTLQTYRKRLEDQKERAEAIVLERDQTYRAGLESLQKFERDFDVASLMTADVNNDLRAQWMIDLNSAKAGHDAAVNNLQRLETELATMEREITRPVPPANPEQAAALAVLQQMQAALEQVQVAYASKHARYQKAAKDVETARANLEALGGEPEERFETITNPKYYEKAQEYLAFQAEEMEARVLVESLEDELVVVEDRLSRLPMIMLEQARLQHEVEVAEQLLSVSREEIQPLRERVAQLRAANLLNSSMGETTLMASGPFEILDLGVPAEDPVVPMKAVIMSVALLIGLGLGAIGPILSEVTRVSFGSAKEVGRQLGVPVLGAVDMILTVRDTRARTVQQALTIATMCLVLVVLGTALYIYAYKQHILPQELRRVLRDLSMALT